VGAAGTGRPHVCARRAGRSRALNPPARPMDSGTKRVRNPLSPQLKASTNGLAALRRPLRPRIFVA